MKHICKIVFIALIVAVVFILRLNLTTEAPILTLEMFRNKKITNKDIPTIMRLVAKAENISLSKLTKTLNCESKLLHYDENGEVIISKTNDSGVGQINNWWKPIAKELGLNLNDPIDNLLMCAWIIKNDTRSWRNWTCYNKYY